MNFQLNLSSESRISVVIFGVLLFFYLYYYIAHSKFLTHLAKGKYTQKTQKSLFRFFMRKLTGFRGCSMWFFLIRRLVNSDSAFCCCGQISR